MDPIPSPRGDDWTAQECAQCVELRSHIEQLEEVLAASKAAMHIMKSERDALLEVLVMSGKVGVV